MSPDSNDDPAATDESADLPALKPGVEHERRNMLVMGLYDVLVRIGWIFKTESVIMPAFLDAVAGAGWLRGLLPVVNRFGQSIPPTFYYAHLRRAPFKRGALMLWTLAMAVAFLTLAAVWWQYGAAGPSWMATFFLTVYAVFSMVYGLNQLSYGTLQGKLISIASRGRLISWSVPIGSWLAVLFAWWLMGDWLRMADGGFTFIFGFTGILFVVAAGCLPWLVERPDEHPKLTSSTQSKAFRGAWEVLLHDANYRRFAVVAMLSATQNILFPHYQALARQELSLAREQLMIWVVVQNLSLGVFGTLLGRVVHRHGERMALRYTMFGMAVAPLLAVALAIVWPEWGRGYYWLVFIPLGMTPMSLKTMLGYTLEASPAHDHPRYLSTMSLCQAAPFVVSPLVGALVDRWGFELIFVSGAALLCLGGFMTLRLNEPRHEIELDALT